MKPLKIKISAFGPYKNCIDIDFEKLGESGIFLITGDTGQEKQQYLIQYLLHYLEK